MESMGCTVEGKVDLPAEDRVSEMVHVAVEAVEEKHGEEVVALDLRGHSAIVDAFVMCTALSSAQARAIADEVEMEFSKRGWHLWRMEGYDTARWILLDYGDIAVHIFREEERRLYDLDRLWGDVPKIWPEEEDDE